MLPSVCDLWWHRTETSLVRFCLLTSSPDTGSIDGEAGIAGQLLRGLTFGLLGPTGASKAEPLAKRATGIVGAVEAPPAAQLQAQVAGIPTLGAHVGVAGSKMDGAKSAEQKLREWQITGRGSGSLLTPIRSAARGSASCSSDDD